MNVIQLGKEWFKEAIKLSEYAFIYQVPESELEERLSEMEKHHQLFGILDKGELAAKFHYLPHEVYFSGKKLMMGGLAGVATYPEYRRQGHVREMLAYVLEKMKQENITVSMLHPFNVSFYRKYGWELFSSRRKTTLLAQDLKVLQHTGGTVKRYSKETHHEDIEKIYDAFASRFTGMLVRDREWWMRAIYDEETTAVYYNENGEPAGYILYQLKEKKLLVDEFVPLNAEARHGLWNFICQHDSMVQEIEMDTHEAEPLLFALPEPRRKSEHRPYFMARIVDAEAFLASYAFTEGTEALFHVNDPHAQWNNGSYLIRKDGTAIRISDDEALASELEGVELSINGLTAILFGYKTLSELEMLGLASGREEEIKAMEKAIPPHRPFFYDFF
ncbi:GNAT family N-acetyltransferase [Bacillus sp. FJAT-42376]|uniref:GNAT family N-acetyltransferase n=1 Tax=Bacillus sp. FJAT-42376 TaxID=2014076 RepID=UPI000F4F9BD6|nr:GNAT family N-acetyltransferase [Bacillus sp. FJAT-42376]AZB42267.1 GNAT family N-acetyltransferase [Bacillus sp. FJAT-42376]